MELHIALFGLLFIIKVVGIQGACDVSRCVTATDTSFFQTCKEYTDTMKCMTTKYDTCTGTADASDTIMSMQAAQRPSDCQLDMNKIASSMTARSEMMSSMWKKSSSGGLKPWSLGATDATGKDSQQGPLFPPFAMMGDDFGEMDDMMGMDDGPFDDGPLDDMDDMMGPALLPGLFGIGSQTQKPPLAPAVTGAKRRGGAARQVDDKNIDKNTDNNAADRLAVSTCLLILLPISIYLDLYLVL